MIRSRKILIMRNRWRWVFLAMLGPLTPGWLASHTL
jgi:hypothetical protein